MASKQESAVIQRTASPADFHFDGCVQFESGRRVLRYVVRPLDGYRVQWRADIRRTPEAGQLARRLGLDNVSSTSVDVSAAFTAFLGWTRSHGIVVAEEDRMRCVQAYAPA